MSYAQSVNARRKSETIRLVGWINVVLSFGVVYFATNMVPALIGACFWVIAVLGITQVLAWRIDKKQTEPIRRS